MKIINILMLFVCTILFIGCAPSSGSLKSHNLMNKFIVEKNYEIASQQVYEMLQICSKGYYHYQKKVFPTTETAEVNATDIKDTFYYTNINFVKIGENKTQVTMYTYQNVSRIKKAAEDIENWLVNNSKKCSEDAAY